MVDFEMMRQSLTDFPRILEVGLTEINLSMEFYFLPHHIERAVDKHIGEQEEHERLVCLPAALEELSAVKEVAVCIA